MHTVCFPCELTSATFFHIYGIGQFECEELLYHMCYFNETLYLLAKSYLNLHLSSKYNVLAGDTFALKETIILNMECDT